MVKRRKRLKRGIASLEKQINLHKDKKDKAEEAGKEELVEYYTREIEAREETKREKERLLRRKQKN